MFSSRQKSCKKNQFDYSSRTERKVDFGNGEAKAKEEEEEVSIICK